jgi:quinol monooxygenase YgiN
MSLEISSFDGRSAPMIVASFHFEVKREKRTEFVHAAEKFVSTLRQSPGCLESQLLSNCEFRSRYTVMSRWEGRTALQRFLQSNDFRALLGTRILLHDPPHICIDEVIRYTQLPGRGRSLLSW